MGLDRDAAAMLVAALRRPRARPASRTPSSWRDVFTETRRDRSVFDIDDPDEGEAFVAARRFAIPAVEAKGSLLLEDVGVPLPALADLVGGVGEDRRRTTT